MRPSEITNPFFNSETENGAPPGGNLLHIFKSGRHEVTLLQMFK
jgi:hypothetical protein